ncbi:MAG: hypothetical protein ACOVMR_05170 [Flavobacteriales bacterium]|jgi:hypothetical protein
MKKNRIFSISIVILPLSSCFESSEKDKIQVVFSYSEAKRLSVDHEKDIFVIIDLWSSSNYRTNEILSNPKLVSMRKSILVLVLNLDDSEFDRTYEELPENLRHLVDMKKTPLYLLMNKNGNILKGPIEYAPSDTIVSRMKM